SVTWRNLIGAQPHKAVQGLIDAYESNDEGDTDEDDTNKGGSNENPDADSSAGYAATAETVPPAKIRKFKLNTREGVRAFIEFAHEPNAYGIPLENGLLQLYLILHAFAYHLVCLEGIPGGYGRLESPPESALLLAEQAKKKLTRRATKFQSAVRKWDKSRWKEVTEGAKEFMERSSRKRGQTASRSGSEVGDDALISDDEVMILSDW
ncbi:hypothetical protein B0H13DRAFT_2037538, partial [Mycena leptocephala]